MIEATREVASHFQANWGRLKNEDTVIQGNSGLEAAREASSLSDKPRLAGYELSHLLGQGSFGQVWSGVQNSTGQAVAVKFFREGDLSYIRRELERLREVSDHFAVVGLVDADLDHHPPYFVMPLLVRSLAGEEGVGARQASRWMRQLAAGLRHSHEKGLLHCDLKPSNVMLDESGSARLVDFGQSRQQGDGVVAWGTLGYMAPEQAGLGSEHEHSCPEVAWDVYGLGATMYRLFTGFCPYWSEEELGNLARLPLAERLRRYRQQIQISPLIPLRKVNPAVDRDLADLIEACLRKSPEQRPSSMTAVLEDLRRRDKGLPLLCRQPWGWSYLAYKWSRRPALVAATLATVALGASVAYSYQRIRLANAELRLKVQQLTVQQAMQAQRAGDFEDAQLWWCQALRNDPNDSVLRLRLGREHFGLTEFSKAVPMPASRLAADPWTPAGFLCSVGADRAAVRQGSRISIVGRDGSQVQLAAPVEAFEARASADVLLTADAARFQLWDTHTGAFLTGKRMAHSNASPRELEFSSDGKLLYGCDNTVSKTWRVDPPHPAWVANAPGEVVKLAWGPAEQWLWVGAENGIERLGPDGKVLEQRPWAQRAFSYAMSSTGVGVAELEGGLQLFWPGGVEELARYQPGQFEVSCQRVFFSEDGRLLLASMPGFLKVWQLEGHKATPSRSVAIAEPPQMLSVSPDGKYVAALCSKLGAPKLQLGVWRLPELDGIPLAVGEIDFKGQPLQLAFGPDNAWIMAGSCGQLTTLSLREPRELGRWQMSLDEDAPFLTGRSFLLTCPHDPSLQKVNLPSGSLAAPAWPLSSAPTALAARGEVAAVSWNEDTALLDLRDGTEFAPRLGTSGLTTLLWGSAGLLGARESALGYWSLPSATGTAEEVMARWEKLTGRTVNLQRSAIEDLTPP